MPIKFITVSDEKELKDKVNKWYSSLDKRLSFLHTSTINLQGKSILIIFYSLVRE